MALSGHTMLATYRQTVHSASVQDSRCNAVYAQQHSAAGSYIYVTLIRLQCDLAKRRSPTRMRQSNVGVVKTTGIRREHPQRLGPVVSIDLATAFRAGLRTDANQHAVGHRMANDFCRVNNGPA